MTFLNVVNIKAKTAARSRIPKVLASQSGKSKPTMFEPQIMTVTIPTTIKLMDHTRSIFFFINTPQIWIFYAKPGLVSLQRKVLCFQITIVSSVFSGEPQNTIVRICDTTLVKHRIASLPYHIFGLLVSQNLHLTF